MPFVTLPCHAFHITLSSLEAFNPAALPPFDSLLILLRASLRDMLPRNLSALDAS